jgi:CHAT domain-containing protein/tetratricopeptide (TPR) repeat protein
MTEVPPNEASSKDPQELSPASIQRLKIIFDRLSVLDRSDDRSAQIALCHEGLEIFRADSSDILAGLLQAQLAKHLIGHQLGERAVTLGMAVAAGQKALHILAECGCEDRNVIASVHEDLALAFESRGGKGDEDQAAYHYGEAIEARVEDFDRTLWAADHWHLASLYTSRGDSENAIEHCREALSVFTPAAQLDSWARVTVLLGLAYLRRRVGQRDENLNEAIACFASVTGCAPAAGSEAFAIAHHNLASASMVDERLTPRERGERIIVHNEEALRCVEFATQARYAYPAHRMLAIAYKDRQKGIRSENFERAAHHFANAIALLSPAGNRREWAELRLNAALLHLAQAPLESGDAELAIRYLTEALGSASAIDDRRLVAILHDQLGKAWLARPDGDPENNVEQAIASFENASAEALPIDRRDWASVESELFGAYAKRLRDDTRQNIVTAIEHARNALTVFTVEAAPQAFAKLSLQLAEIFVERAPGPRAQNLARAAGHAREALMVISRTEAPFDWAQCHSILGITYLLREAGSPEEAEDKALEHFTQALEIVAANIDPWNWALLQMNVGLVHYRRSRRDRTGHIDKSIACFRAALNVAEPDGPPLLQGRIHANLATTLSDRTDGDRPGNEDAAAGHFERAAGLLSRTEVPREWAMLKYNQGRFLVHRRSGDKSRNVESAIAALDQALKIRTRETFPREWALTHDVLGSAYAARTLGTPRENRARAVEHYSLALQVLTEESEPYQWGLTMSNLAIVYHHWDEGDAADNLETAIRLNEAALKVFTLETYRVEFARVCANLGTQYADRFKGNVAANVEASIDYYHRALAVYDRTNYPFEWASAQNALGGSYVKRIGGEAFDNVEHAIDHMQLALVVRTEKDFPQDWATTLTNLAGALLRRRGGDPEHNRQTAIEYLQKAVRVLGSSAPIRFRIGAQFNLAMALITVRSGDVAAYRRRALATLEEITAIAPRDQMPVMWANAQAAMGTASFELADGDRASNIAAGIACSERALEIFDRQTYPFQWADTQRNIGAFRIARDDVAQRDLEIGIGHLRDALTVFTLEAQSNEYRRTHLMLGEAHFRHDNYEVAEESFSEAAAAGALLLASAYTEVGRRYEVATTPDLFASSAFSLIQLGRPADALVRLEQGKTRLLNQAMVLDNLDLDILEEAERASLRSLRRQIHELEAEMRLPPDTPARRTDRELADTLGRVRGEMTKLVDFIRLGQPDFMPDGLDLTAVLRLIPVGGAMIAPLFTSKGSAVFVLPHGSVTVTAENIIMLEGMTDADLHSMLYGADSDRLGGWLGAYSNRETESLTWLTTIETTGQVLWDRLAAPIHRQLQALGIEQEAPILLLPQGGLGILPLHAAWRLLDGCKRYLLDDWTPSYSPSGFAFEASRSRLSKRERYANSVLAVIDPTIDLPFTPAEGDVVLELFPTASRKSLREHEATADAVIENVPGRSYVHFACHGVYDWRQPMQSRLLLANSERLTLADIVSRLDVSAARLIALSACETGLTDVRSSPDEYVGLPAAFLRRGAPAVVSSLWAVSDFSTMLLMHWFYRSHLRNGLDPASALRAAQRWLRDATNAELVDILAQWQAETHAGRGPALDQALQTFRQQLPSGANKRPFAHPYHWAAFTMSGY